MDTIDIDERTAIERSLDIAMAMRGTSKKMLAVKMKVTGAYVTKITKDGRMSVNNLAKVCDALNMKVWEFMKLGEEL